NARDAAEIAIAAWVGRGIRQRAVLRAVALRGIEAEVLVDFARRKVIRHQARMNVGGVKDRQSDILTAQVGRRSLLRASGTKQQADVANLSVHVKSEFRTKR